MTIKALLLSVCVLALAPAICNAQTAPVAASVAADTPQTLPGGTTFTLPKAWSMRTIAGGLVAVAPEGDLEIAAVEVMSATSAQDAADKAWAIYRPDAHRTVKLVTPKPGRDGWDDAADIDYETSPNEKIYVGASVRHKGSLWLVQILDGAQGTTEKRGAAVDLLFSSALPGGFTRESFVGRAAHPLDAARVAEMKAFVTYAMAQLDIPGASMALIDHGKVVYEGGFGVRQVGKPAKVDAHTLFMMASNTKSMSTLLLAEQVDAGKVRWDEKVTDVYPSFRLGSEATTQKVEIRHLVCACTGLPRKDMDWFFNTPATTPPTATFTLLAGTEPTSGFGEVFQYNNFMASAAGYIAGHLAYPALPIGEAYDKAMQVGVFTPLGMNDTTFDFKKALSGNYAVPYSYDANAKVARVMMEQNRTAIPYRPAAGAWSSAHDMILYVENELTKGKLPNSRQLISEENLLERRTSTVPSGEYSRYGMGLETDTQWGVPVIHHGGSMAGYKSDFMLIPDADVGAVILTSSDNGRPMLRPFMRRLLEVLYDGKPEAMENVAANAKAGRAWYLKEREKMEIPAKGLSLASSYSNPDLGFVRVTVRKGHTWVQVPSFSSEVASRRNDDGTTSLMFLTPSLVGMEFVVGEKDGHKTLILRDGQHEYVYLADR